MLAHCGMQRQNAGMSVFSTTLAYALFLAAASAQVVDEAKPKLTEAVRDGYVKALDDSQLDKLEKDHALPGLDAYSHFMTAAELQDYSRLPEFAVFARVIRPDTLYLRIPVFHSRTVAQLHAQLTGRESVPAVILDVRGNRGGLLNAATEIADEFVDSGTLAQTVGRSDYANLLFLAKPGGRLAGSKVLVLLDADSASASELLAGILRQSHSAVLMGRASTGKSAVQSILPLDDGQRLSLTTAYYFFADGSTVPASGLKPDIRLSRSLMKASIPTWQSPPARFQEDPVLLQAMAALWP
jgi:hypothetical protein